MHELRGTRRGLPLQLKQVRRNRLVLDLEEALRMGGEEGAAAREGEGAARLLGGLVEESGGKLLAASGKLE